MKGYHHITSCFGITFAMLLFVTGVLIADEPIQIRFALSDSSDSHFYLQPNTWSPIYTDASTLELTGKASNHSLNFLLLEINHLKFPLEVHQGAFSRTIPLQSGENSITISSSQRHIKAPSQTIFRLHPASIEKLVTCIEGGIDREIPFSRTPGKDATIQVRLPSPVVRIEGILGTNDVTELKVKDNYNNTLPLEFLGENRFAINYTMRNTSATLKFITTLSGQVLQTSTMHMELQNMIQIGFDSKRNPSGWIFRDPQSGHFVTQLDTVFLDGNLGSVEEGEVELDFRNQSLKIPVVKSNFDAEIRLLRNQINRGRIKIRLNDQLFFESFLIEQTSPIVKIKSLHQVLLEGSLHLPGMEIKPQEGMPLELRESLLQLKGSAKFDGNLSLVLMNESTGNPIEVIESPGDFEFEFPLHVGRHTYSLQLTGGGFSKPYYSFEVDTLPAIKVDAVNYLPYRSGTIKLSKPELLLRGSVSGIKRGLMNLHLADEVYPIAILDGSFEMNKAIPVSEGSTEFSLVLKSNRVEFSNQYQLEFVSPSDADPEAPERLEKHEPETDASQDTVSLISSTDKKGDNKAAETSPDSEPKD